MRLGKRLAAIAISAAMGLGALPGAALGAGSWERVAGKDAFETMQRVVQADGAFTAETVDAVVVATSEGYWDALAAAGLAGLEGAPVLITPKGSLAAQTRQEIERLAPSRILVMGGRGAVSDAVLGELGGLGASVERVAGMSAPETAIEICREGAGRWGDTFVVATSAGGYWDALSIAPFAYAQGAPIILAGPDGRLTDGALAEIASGSFGKAVIVGGGAAVSREVEGQLAGIDVTRLAGQDALETSSLIASFEMGQGMDATNLFVATTNDYYDALTGASLAGRENGVLVLVHPSGGTRAVDDLVAAGLQVGRGRVLGGRAAVSDENLGYIEALTSGEAEEPAVIVETDPTPQPSYEPVPDYDYDYYDSYGDVREVSYEDASYVANTNTKKFHYKGCSYVDRMSAENTAYTDMSREELMGIGYDPCGRCNP